MTSKLLQLDLFEVGLKRALSHSALYNTRLYHHDDFLGNTILDMKAELLAYVHNPSFEHYEVFTNTISAPRFANPWEHLKARYAGRPWFRWYIKRYPITFIDEKYFVQVVAEFDLKEVVTFPQSKIRFPVEMGPVVIRVQENSRRIMWEGSVDNPQQQW
jgi:hypothetical protein